MTIADRVDPIRVPRCQEANIFFSVTLIACYSAVRETSGKTYLLTSVCVSDKKQRRCVCVLNIGREGASEERRISSSAMAKEVEDDARKRDRVARSVVGAEPSSVEQLEKPSNELEKSRNGKNDDEAVTDRNGEKNRESRYEGNGNEGGTQETEKIVWPIGVPWEPVVPSTAEEKEVARKKDDEVEVTFFL